MRWPALPRPTPAADVAEAARACRWVVIQGGSWFAHVAWDLGVGALRPDGASAAVLVATDED
ncbi:MAG: DUF6183 family protein [Planctomycetota bacterium]